MKVEQTIRLDNRTLPEAASGPGPRPDRLDFAELNAELRDAQPIERVRWAMRTYPDQTILTSSFGIQSAVLLHMVTRVKPDVPVVMIDTGYLFPETYQFVDELTDRLNLNLWVFRPRMSSAWQETRYGKLWEGGKPGIEKYNYLNKIEPMQRALQELNAKAWITGLRKDQSDSRQHIETLGLQDGVCKIHPIHDWSNRDVHYYLKEHDLPYHPLWEQGYVSVGDVQTTRKLEAGMDEQDTRFYGLKRECGIHEASTNVDFSI
ncbi:MAG: phosphoadenylyl-sulfate reductase [Verrucomicrobiota bacterium]